MSSYQRNGTVAYHQCRRRRLVCPPYLSHSSLSEDVIHCLSPTCPSAASLRADQNEQKMSPEHAIQSAVKPIFPGQLQGHWIMSHICKISVSCWLFCCKPTEAAHDDMGQKTALFVLAFHWKRSTEEIVILLLLAWRGLTNYGHGLPWENCIK